MASTAFSLLFLIALLAKCVGSFIELAPSHDYVFIGDRKTTASDALADLLKLFGASATSSSE